MTDLQAGDWTGLLVLVSLLVGLLWLGAAKRQLERRRQRASNSLR
jgi:hypothetical protein